MTRAKTSTSSGFTLVEVLVAVVVLAFSLGAVFSSVNHYSFQLGKSRDRFHANRVAMHVAAEFKVLKSWPSLGRTNKSIQVGGKRWTWTATTTNTPDKNVRRVTIEIFPDGKNKFAAKVLIFQSKPL